ncbi:flavin-containing monooxygenase [Phyllobacterium zundukense]|uniref:Monooxygenase n=1 Tax=Phyllobacterium zundukense TaxID=1867719 RepID=A0A2N9W0N6_9HYPH|nr:NAD(P)/FAD-dependent oxidoreductase [Phyllobacterium zundukense]ATU95450.1 monooxygenase [Phyllobacterium zundukense]PIO45304.1 monooxygenase [Phyllobacterium zundukense]
MNNDVKSDYEVIVLGAGFGGLGMAAQLKLAGRDDFLIVEAGDEVGGVWRENSYPGSACDTEAHLYCYSFFPHLRVSRMYAGRDELLGYVKALVRRFELEDKIQLNSRIDVAEWDASVNRWRFKTSDGSTLTSRFFVPAWGQLNRPSIPPFNGLETFAGERFHSANWKHDVNLIGKKVASVGNAASAVQYVPAIAPVVDHLTVFQRSANWIMPRNQIVFSEEQLEAYESNPALFEASRKSLHEFRETGFQRTRHGTDAQKEGIRIALEHLEKQVPDEALRRKLTPDYEFACKRILRSDDYFPALMRSNVMLETNPIAQFVPDGIVTADGTHHFFDVVIFGTGFESQAFNGDLDVFGRGKRKLRDAWSAGAEAYLGMTVPDFPNMFMIYGPNTNLNHNSIITMLEIQQRYVIDAVEDLGGRGSAVEVKADVFASFNTHLQAAMENSAFSSNCSSWYKNAAGKVINNWSGTVDEYRALAGWSSAHYVLHPEP